MGKQNAEILSDDGRGFVGEVLEELALDAVDIVIALDVVGTAGQGIRDDVALDAHYDFLHLAVLFAESLVYFLFKAFLFM